MSLPSGRGRSAAVGVTSSSKAMRTSGLERALPIRIIALSVQVNNRELEHAPHNAIEEAHEIERFRDRCSDLMRELLDELAAEPGRARTFPEIEDALGWPHRRIASVLGGVCRLRMTEFEGRRPYRFHDARHAASGRWEMWMDVAQASAARTAQRRETAEMANR